MRNAWEGYIIVNKILICIAWKHSIISSIKLGGLTNSADFYDLQFIRWLQITITNVSHTRVFSFFWLEDECVLNGERGRKFYRLVVLTYRYNLITYIALYNIRLQKHLKLATTKGYIYIFIWHFMAHHEKHGENFVHVLGLHLVAILQLGQYLHHVSND